MALLLVVATQLTEYPAMLGRLPGRFLNRVNRFYLTQFLFTFTQFYFYAEIKTKTSNNLGKN